MTQAPTPANWLSILVLGVIWGGTFMVVAIALEGYGPLTVAAARTTLGALAMLALMRALHRPMPDPAPGLWPAIVGIGAFSTAIPFFLLAWGQQYVPSAYAGITMAALPLFVLPLAHAFSDEAMSGQRLLGVLVGFAGAFVLIGPGALSLGDGPVALAEFACLAATLSYAFGSILTRQCPPVDPITLTALMLSVGAVCLVPLMLIFEGLPGWTGPRTGGAILFLGVFPTALAALLRTGVIRSAGSVFMTLVNYQVPLWSMLFGVAVLGEVLPFRFFAALAMILAGLAISQWGALRRLARRSRT